MSDESTQPTDEESVFSAVEFLRNPALLKIAAEYDKHSSEHRNGKFSSENVRGLMETNRILTDYIQQFQKKIDANMSVDTKLVVTAMNGEVVMSVDGLKVDIRDREWGELDGQEDSRGESSCGEEADLLALSMLVPGLLSGKRVAACGFSNDDRNYTYRTGMLMAVRSRSYHLLSTLCSLMLRVVFP